MLFSKTVEVQMLFHLNKKKDCFHIRIRNMFDRQVLYSLSAIKYIYVRQHEDSKVLKKNLEPTLYILKLCEILVS